MFTGPVGPVEVFFYWPEADFRNFYWPGAIGSPLASSPALCNSTSPKFPHFAPRLEVLPEKTLQVQPMHFWKLVGEEFFQMSISNI